MIVKRNIILLCTCVVFSSGVVGKTKEQEFSEGLTTHQGNVVELGQFKEVRRRGRQLPYSYDEYAAQNANAAQNNYGASVQYQNPSENPNGYNPVGRDSYEGYEQSNRKPGFVSGRVRPGETVSIGNGRGKTNVVAINSNGDSDYYVGYTDGGSNYGYDQGPTYPNKKAQNGILVNKKPNGQEDVLLWNSNGNKQSGIAVENDGAELYAGNNYDQGIKPNPHNYNSQPRGYNVQKPRNQGYGAKNNNHHTSSSTYRTQDQVYLISERNY